MSAQNALEFIRIMNTREDLFDRFVAVQREGVQYVVALGAQMGFQFSVEDFRVASRQYLEILSETLINGDARCS